jgi:hypothetical protein
MKQTIVAPAKRTEGSIISDIADAQTAVGAGQQELAGLEARRARMLATGTLDEIHGLADSLARAKLKVEIAESRANVLNNELKRLYEGAAQAAVDAELAPLAAIDAEELASVRSYEQHAAAVAADLAKFQELDARRHQVSVAVHRLTGQWTQFDSPTNRSSLANVKLPSATGDKDFWPRQSTAVLEAHARDAAALEEYHRGGSGD